MMNRVAFLGGLAFACAGIAHAQSNYTFAQRSAFTVGAQAQTNLFVKLPYQPVTDTTYVPCTIDGSPRPQPSYLYSSWYSLQPTAEGFLRIENADFYSDLYYYGSSLASLGKPTLVHSPSEIYVYYLQVKPGQEFILRHCAEGDQPLSAQTIDATAKTVRLSFLPGIAADLAVDQVLEPAGGGGVRTFISLLNQSSVPSSDFTIRSVVEVPSETVSSVEMWGPGGVRLAVGHALGNSRYEVTYRVTKGEATISPNTRLSNYYAIITKVGNPARSDFYVKTTTTLESMANPDPNLSNNTSVKDYVPPPPPGGSGPVGAGANVPTATEWQMLIFGGLLFGAAVLSARRRHR